MSDLGRPVADFLITRCLNHVHIAVSLIAKWANPVVMAYYERTANLISLLNNLRDAPTNNAFEKKLMWTVTAMFLNPDVLWCETTQLHGCSNCTCELLCSIGHFERMVWKAACDAASRMSTADTLNCPTFNNMTRMNAHTHPLTGAMMCVMNMKMTFGDEYFWDNFCVSTLSHESNTSSDSDDKPEPGPMPES